MMVHHFTEETVNSKLENDLLNFFIIFKNIPLKGSFAKCLFRIAQNTTSSECKNFKIGIYMTFFFGIDVSIERIFYPQFQLVLF